MAIINYIPNVKTATGFDTLNTVSTFINHTATGVFTNGDTYEVNIPAPDEILTGQFSLIFVPDSDSIAGMKISINNGVGIPIYAGDMPILAGALKSGVATELLVDTDVWRAYSIDAKFMSMSETKKLIPSSTLMYSLPANTNMGITGTNIKYFYKFIPEYSGHIRAVVRSSGGAASGNPDHNVFIYDTSKASLYQTMAMPVNTIFTQAQLTSFGSIYFSGGATHTVGSSTPAGAITRDIVIPVSEGHPLIFTIGGSNTQITSITMEIFEIYYDEVSI